MAVQKQDGLHTDVGESAVDLRGQEFKFCTRNAAGTIELCGDGGSIAGVISEGKQAGYHTSFNTKGNPILKVISGAAFTRGQDIQSNNAGLAVPGSTKKFGVARNSGRGGEMCEISTDTTS